jgi:hypothetical protein
MARLGKKKENDNQAGRWALTPKGLKFHRGLGFKLVYIQGMVRCWFQLYLQTAALLNKNLPYARTCY